MSQQKYNKTVQVQVTIIPRQPGKKLSVSPSRKQVQAGFFRLSMKGEFDVYLLWPFGKKFILILQRLVSTFDSTISQFTAHLQTRLCLLLSRMSAKYPFQYTVNTLNLVFLELELMKTYLVEYLWWLQTFFFQSAQTLLVAN